MKKIITKNEYLALQGLFYIGKEAYKKAEECEIAFINLVRKDQTYGIDSGYFGDQMITGGTLDRALELEEIKIKK
jgi:hypothetical protein